MKDSVLNLMRSRRRGQRSGLDKVRVRVMLDSRKESTLSVLIMSLEF